MREGFVFYRSFWEAIKSLPDDLRLEVIGALADYALDGAEPAELSPVAAGFLALMRPQIDANNARYDNGCKGGRPKKEPNETEQKPNENPTETEKNPTETEKNLTETEQEPKEKEKEKDKYKDKEKEIYKERERRRFTPPTTDEVQGYCNEKGYSVDAERFVSYYEANGWRVGRNPMKDWRAAIRNWATHDKRSPDTQGLTRGTDYDALVRRLR